MSTVHKTLNILGLAVFHGIVVSLFGPSLLDLADVFHSDIQHVSYLSFTTTFAALIGCSLANYIYGKFHSQGVIIFGVLLKGLSNAALPLVKTLEGAHLVSLVFGFSLGFLETGVYVWLVTLYSKSRLCAAVLQTFHLMFGVGSLMGSIIIRPFVTPQSNLASGSKYDRGSSRIYIAYLIVAAFALGLALSLLISLMLDSTPDVKTQNDRRRSIISGGSSLKPNHFALSGLIGLHGLISLVIFLCLARYISVYAVLKGMSKDDSVLLMSSFYSCFTISRLVSVFLASRFQPETFLIIVDSIFFLSVIVFFYYGSLSHRALHISIALLGGTCGPIYAAGTAYLVSRLTQLNHAQTSILKFMANCGGLVPPLAIGPLIESTPQVFPEVILFSTILLIMVSGYVVLTENYLSENENEPAANSKPIERVSLLSKVM